MIERQGDLFSENVRGEGKGMIPFSRSQTEFGNEKNEKMLTTAFNLL
jgi:hypothetical protein